MTATYRLKYYNIAKMFCHLYKKTFVSRIFNKMRIYI